MIRASIRISKAAFFSEYVDFDALEFLDTLTNLKFYIFPKLLRWDSNHTKSFILILHTQGPESVKLKMSLKPYIRGHHRLSRTLTKRKDQYYREESSLYSINYTLATMFHYNPV